MANYYPGIVKPRPSSVLDNYMARRAQKAQEEERAFQRSRQVQSDVRATELAGQRDIVFGQGQEDRGAAATQAQQEAEIAQNRERAIIVQQFAEGGDTPENYADMAAAQDARFPDEPMPEYGEGVFDKVQDAALGWMPQAEEEAYTLAKGAKRFEGGEEIASNVQPDKPPAPGSSEKDTEYFAGLMGITDPKEKAKLGLMLKSRAGTGQDITPTRAQVTKQNELWQEYDTTISNVEDMIADVEEDPTLVGIVGSARKAAQTATGIGEDFSRLVGEIPAMSALFDWVGSVADEDSQLTEEQKATFADDPKLSKLRLFEHNLGYALARSRQPRGRLLADTIKRSMEDAKLTGMTSSKDVLYRMREVLRLLKENRTNVEEIKRGETRKAVGKYVPGQGLVFDAATD